MPPAGEDGGEEGPNEQGGTPDRDDRTVDTERVSESDERSVGEREETASSDDRARVTEDVEAEESDRPDSREPSAMRGEEGEVGREEEDPLAVEREVGPDGPGAEPKGDGSDDGVGGPIGWVLRSDHTGATFLREFVGSALVVLVIGLLLFAISGVWPPMVAVESGSMEPQMERGDLVFVMDQNRFKPGASVMGTGIATYRSSSGPGYQKFGDYGDVIIYQQDGSQRETPIIHRARFWVNGSENWYDKADESFVNGDDCGSTTNCPAPHSGFITKGDNNNQYDQVSGISGPVKPEWIKGTAELRIPWLGHVRLELSGLTVYPSSLGVPSLPRGVSPGALGVSSSPGRASG